MTDPYWKYHADEDPELGGGPMPAERKGAAYGIRHRRTVSDQSGQPPHHTRTIPSAIKRPGPISNASRAHEGRASSDMVTRAQRWGL